MTPMSEFEIDREFLTGFLVDLLNVPSPSGDCDAAIDFCAQALQGWPLDLTRTEKGALTATWSGGAGANPRAGANPGAGTHPRALTAHVDTLGVMVKEIKDDGRLKMTNLGGLNYASIECEGVRVRTLSGDEIAGSIMPVKASSHVHGEDALHARRDADSLEIRLDVCATAAADVEKLGIRVGDFVYIDPRVERHNGFIRSRFLDDKACVACMVASIKALADAGLAPTQRTTFHFSTYEEVGHGGAAGFPADIVELLTLDMAAVGSGQASDEFSVSICAKDSGGPYHHGLTRQLVSLAEVAGVAHKMDIYPGYSSDGGALWRAGADVRVALIGPGIDGSHSYERTHEDALVETTRLIVAYLLSAVSR